jgi:subtilase family serine protease
VTPIDDPTAELDETVVVSLRFDPSYFVGNPGKATVTIVSDELLSDLTVSALTVPGGAAAGDTITIGDTTANPGGGAADASVTRLYLSTDSIVDGGDTVLGSRSVPALAPGANSPGTTSVTIPSGTVPGTYFILAVADAPQAVIESNEENNQLARTIQVGPDLVISAFTAPTAAGAGVTFSVTDTTRNAGAGASAGSTTRFYLSANAVWEPTDLALGSRAVPALAAGATSSATTALTIPAGTTGGVYYILARADADGIVAEASETNNLGSALVRVGPDLTVSAFTVPAGGGAGGTISVTDTTANQGGGTAPASTTRFYLSADYSWNATDTSLGTRAVPALAAGAASTATTTLTIPAGTPSGFWYVLARADSEQGVAEADEANNVTARPITLGADLVVYFAQPVPAAAAPGDTITVSDMVTNLGAGAAGASTTRFYLSADGILDAGDPMLGARAVPALGAGASSTGSTALTLPGGLAAGTYSLFAKADADEVVGETSETNNRTFGFIQIGADLIVSPLTVPAVGGAGVAITLTDTTRNQAGAGAAASTTRFYLSANSAWDAGDVLLGSRAVPALAAGAASTGSTVVVIPAGTATGGYWIIAKADADSAVGETQEANNAAAAAIQIGPDLLMSALTAPASAGAGASITVNDTTRNHGGGTAGASTTRFYLSADVLLDGGDTLLGARAVPALAGGTSHPAATVVTIPTGTATGAWFLLARADADGAVGETTETNNVTSTTLQVGGDLVVSAFTVPTAAGAGATITVSDTTTNQGAGPVAASVTGFYLSADSVLDAGDTPLSGRAVPALGAAAAHAASTALVIPAGVAGGTWYVIARADAGGTIGETFETNNATVRSILIGADLVVSPFSAPASSGAGAVLTVTDTTRNQGGAPAGASVTSFWLSSNAVWDAGDTFLGSRPVPALAIGGTHAASTPLTLPPDVAAGIYYVLARADGDGTVAETIETNNTAFASVQIGPDLILSAFSAPPAAGAGVAVTVSDTTRNQGGGAAAASTASFWLSTNPTWDAGDTFLGSRAVPALAPGATHAAQTVVTIPAGTAPGLYYLLGRADSDATVGETQEANNNGFVAINVGPDLRISWVGGPGTAPLGQTITVSDTTSNAGGGAVGASTTSFYLSTNTGWDASDIFLGSRAVPALAGGASSTGSITVTIPAGTGPGGYYLLARADSEGVVPEGQEANNVNYTTLTLGPDLFVFLSGVPGSAAAGSTITIGDTTRNSTGGGTAGASTTRFYLSANAAWDAGDTAIGSRAVPALAPGGSNLGSTSVTIPAGTPAGTWYLIARADADGDVPESFEINNTHYIAIQVTP